MSPASTPTQEATTIAGRPVRVLVVDDDADHLRVVCDQLDYHGFDVTGVEDAEQALARIQKVDPEVVVTDVRMPGMDGFQLLERVRSATEDVDVIVMTGHQDMSSAVAAMKGGAFDYLVKPIRMAELTDRLEACIAERKLRVQLEEEAAQVEDGREEAEGTLLVGRDPRMIEIYKTIGVLARNRATVLIRGETGTGKEMIARAIHETSVHAEAPFLPVNCTALSDNLLESELFGHVRGAFTGAVAGRKGYFEMAETGSIFLDEIGDTSPDFQAKLLRVLQEKTFYPVGSEKPMRTEARVLAATHRPIEKLVEKGSFREDLYFRLKVVEISVPPLRERKGDIPVLARHLLERIQEGIHQDVRYISDEAMKELVAYPWPGNVRELEHTLTRAAIICRSGVIRPDHLALGAGGLRAGGNGVGGAFGAAVSGGAASGAGAPAASAAASEAEADEAELDEALRLDRMVSEHIRSVLERTDGDRDEALRLLGITAEELEQLVETHDIEMP